jgi:hypothetical protein
VIAACDLVHSDGGALPPEAAAPALDPTAKASRWRSPEPFHPEFGEPSASRPGSARQPLSQTSMVRALLTNLWLLVGGCHGEYEHMERSAGRCDITSTAGRAGGPCRAGRQDARLRRTVEGPARCSGTAPAHSIRVTPARPGAPGMRDRLGGRLLLRAVGNLSLLRAARLVGTMPEKEVGRQDACPSRQCAALAEFTRALSVGPNQDFARADGRFPTGDPRGWRRIGAISRLVPCRMRARALPVAAARGQSRIVGSPAAVVRPQGRGGRLPAAPRSWRL